MVHADTSLMLCIAVDAPIMLFVLFMRKCSCGKAARMAANSAMSPAGVDVACAFTYEMSDADTPDCCDTKQAGVHQVGRVAAGCFPTTS